MQKKGYAILNNGLPKSNIQNMIDYWRSWFHLIRMQPECLHLLHVLAPRLDLSFLGFTLRNPKFFDYFLEQCVELLPLHILHVNLLKIIHPFHKVR